MVYGIFYFLFGLCFCFGALWENSEKGFSKKIESEDIMDFFHVAICWPYYLYSVAKKMFGR